MSGNPKQIVYAGGMEIRREHLTQDALAKYQEAHAKAVLALWPDEPREPVFTHPNLAAIVAEANRILYRAQQEEADKRVLAASSDAYAVEQAKVDARTAAHMASMSTASVRANRRKGEASRTAVITAAAKHLRTDPHATREQTAAAIQPAIGTVKHDRITFYLKESGLFKARRPRRLGRSRK